MHPKMYYTIYMDTKYKSSCMAMSIYCKYTEGRICEVGIPGFDVIRVHLSSQSPLTVLYMPKFNHSFGVRPGLPTSLMPSHVYTVCPRSLDPFYIVSYIMRKGQDFLDIQYVFALCLHYSGDSFSTFCCTLQI